MTPLVEQKLREAWDIGASDVEAALFAGISAKTLVNHISARQDLAEARDALKQLPTFQARQVVVSGIRKKDIAVSQWYLERKARDEFAKTPEIAAISVDLSSLLEEVEKREAREMERPDVTIPEKAGLVESPTIGSPTKGLEANKE